MWSFINLLMINWASEVLYHVESGDHGHGDTHSKSAALAPASIYNIEVEEETVVVESNLEDLLAVADVSKGQKYSQSAKLVTNLQMERMEQGHIYIMLSIVTLDQLMVLATLLF